MLWRCLPGRPVPLFYVKLLPSHRAMSLGALCWLILLSPSARAGDYQYPKDEPAFNVTLPEGWTIIERPGPAQILLCTPGGDDNYIISLIRVPNVNNKADLTTILTRITQAGALGAGLTGVTVSNPTDETIGPGARTFTKVTASGKHDGSDGAYTYYAFQLVPGGKYYAVGVAGLQVMIAARKAEFERVALSVRPLK